MFTMPTTGVPVPRQKAGARKPSCASWAGEDRSGRAGLEAAGVEHLTLHPYSFPSTVGRFSAFLLLFRHRRRIAGILEQKADC